MYLVVLKFLLGIGDWGLGIGDWGLGPIPNPQSPIPKSPIPNPQSPIPKFGVNGRLLGLRLVYMYSICIYLIYYII